MHYENQLNIVQQLFVTDSFTFTVLIKEIVFFKSISWKIHCLNLYIRHKNWLIYQDFVAFTWRWICQKSGVNNVEISIVHLYQKGNPIYCHHGQKYNSHYSTEIRSIFANILLLPSDWVVALEKGLYFNSEHV